MYGQSEETLAPGTQPASQAAGEGHHCKIAPIRRNRAREARASPRGRRLYTDIDLRALNG